MTSEKLLKTIPTPLIKLGKIGIHHDVVVKDESANPTGTFKDRLSVAAVSGPPRDVLFGSISYGNTAVSFARSCGGVSWAEFVAFTPVGFSDWIFGPSSTGRVINGRDFEDLINADGASLIEIDLNSKTFGDEDLASLADSADLLSGRSFVNVTEGIAVPAYSHIALEALEQLGDAPDVCIVQYGAGILANEVRDVFAGLSKITTVIPISTPNPQSLAKMLYGPVWIDVNTLSSRGVAMSLHSSPDRTGAVRSPYPVYALTEDHVRRGIEIATDIGLSAEPSGAAGLGYLDTLEAVIPNYNPRRHRVLVINTGNGIDHVAKRRL